jgi:hypothetical protein
MNYLKPIFLFLFLIFTALFIRAQNPHNLIDGISEDRYCTACQNTIEEKPKEVLFGININENGDVFFSMANEDWFNRIFAAANGITIDIVPKTNYRCDLPFKEREGLFKGYVLPPLYKQNFKPNRTDIGDGVMIKIGRLPANLIGKEVEGNLVILNGNYVCYYQNFINIARSNWNLLPMGLYTDTLLNTSSSFTTGRSDFFTYSQKLQTVVLFPKNKSTYNEADIKPLYDSLGLKNYTVKKIEIRAYSSVEGPTKINRQLMQNRANAMLRALKKYGASVERSKIVSAENWLEFLADIKGTKYSYFNELPKAEIKQKLTDAAVASALEPYLSKHRKAIVTVYVEAKSKYSGFSESNIQTEFEQSVKNKEVDKARILLKEIVDRITDNKLPETYLNELEVPMEQIFVPLLGDKEVYKYLLLQTSEYEALEMFKQLKALDPNNGKVQYNICALSLFAWQSGDNSVKIDQLLPDIQLLPKMGVDSSLMNRMLVNYHILLSSYYMSKGKYDLKDSSVFYIRDAYLDLKLTDDDVYSLAKYFAYYSQFSWAETIVKGRVDQLDVSEDLVFYFINLMFYHTYMYETEDLKKAMLNAINLNPKRFCNFFTSNDRGGASMQLLDEEVFRKLYCETCTGQADLWTKVSLPQKDHGQKIQQIKTPH